ncbi:hypothetical protein CYLTODRAFT_423101 [Cylindrobasidium torrendii FP15055 ss-10]|uniref:Mediator of RNA polymerase II transcription subunit 13 n=1 Tax=Cylindrobasidium torrendii FP15055 ss-10 TaxID=1314674 RepID=A0A0D7BB81_9AGAR|nr:hypothetical protein CYLTODRAFT_423101 [Cylindrobasidium torrendii FP15055 ss-10]
MSLNVALLDADVSHVAYVVVSSALAQPIDVLRRNIYEKNADKPLVGSLHISVQVGVTTFMHIFRISQTGELDLLDGLDLSQVSVLESSSFTPHDIVSTAFPPTSLRSVVSHFFDALRSTLIDRVSRQSGVLARLRTGFLVCQDTTASTEWSAPWAVIRPLAFCHLQIHFAQSRLIVHPLIISTPFIPLAPSLPTGTPITLCPFGITAYYLASYHGPTNALSRQFQDLLVGLGVHAWNRDAFVVAWIVVENKQGDDKGVTVIYPRSLCVRAHPSKHPDLPCIPSIPATLEASPDAALPTPVMSPLSLSSASPNTFRTLTATKNRDLPSIANQIGQFVDDQAALRELERERLKREREGGPSSRNPSQIFAPAPDPTPAPPVYIAPQPVPIVPTPAIQVTQAPDNFYPSPPQTNTAAQPTPAAAAVSSPVMDVDPQPVQSMPYYDANWMDSFLAGTGEVNASSGMMMSGDDDFGGVGFTEDDFKFFDAKPDPNMSTGLTPAPNDNIWEAFGTGLPAVTPAFIPQSSPIHMPSPQKPPPPPETSFIMEDIRLAGRAASGQWDAIPFAPKYRSSDSKYSAGKFKSGLASPPAESERYYRRSTDPSLAMVKRLREKKGGLKGRITPTAQESEEEWMSVRSPVDSEEVEEESDEDMESESEEEDETGMTRPSTPLSGCMLSSPALLSMHFNHAYLLPQSSPLRQGMNSAAVGVNPVLSVPTPVSPGPAGKTKALELAVASLAREMVENVVWSDAWRDIHSTAVASVDIWDRDIAAVSTLLAGVDGVRAPLSMQDLFGLGPSDERFEKLEPPSFIVGKGEAVMQMSPPSLRFWDKLGLGPRSGRKDLRAFVAFDPNQQDLTHRVPEWMSALGRAYSSKQFGKVSPGVSEHCADGVVQLRFDSSLRKSLDTLAKGIPTPPPRTYNVVIIVLPLSALQRPQQLRQLFDVIVKTSKSLQTPLLFQLIPEQIMRGDFSTALPSLCLSLYDRLRVPVVRSMSRDLFNMGEMQKLIEDPAFVIARTAEETKMVLGPLKSGALGSVLDVGTFLHVAYSVSTCGNWLCMACVDQRGEAHDTGVRLTIQGGGGGDDDEDDTAFLVSTVWEFARKFARMATASWRVVIAKLGVMECAELEAWTVQLERVDEPIHVSVVCAEVGAPYMFTGRPAFAPPPAPGRAASVSTTKPSRTVMFMDVTATTYALYQATPLPVSVPPTLADLGLETHCIEEEGEEDGLEKYPHRLPLTPRATGTLIRVPSVGTTEMLHVHLLYGIHSEACAVPVATEAALVRDVTRSWYALSVLAAARMGEGCGILPYHLAAIERMRDAVRLVDVGPEGAPEP